MNDYKVKIAATNDNGTIKEWWTGRAFSTYEDDAVSYDETTAKSIVIKRWNKGVRYYTDFGEMKFSARPKIAWPGSYFDNGRRKNVYMLEEIEDAEDDND